MKTMTIRDLRQRWPEAEKALDVESEIIVTRDGAPVAKLVRTAPVTKSRKRFDPGEHRRWQSETFGKKRCRVVDALLTAGREDRSSKGRI